MKRLKKRSIECADEHKQGTTSEDVVVLGNFGHECAKDTLLCTKIKPSHWTNKFLIPEKMAPHAFHCTAKL